jgi:glycosyltransferase involved in cell wall biosynthesis
MAAAPEVSVVIPFYDEEENVAPLFAELVPVLEACAPAYEIVAVNDGSRDRTQQALLEAAGRHPRVRCLRLARNSGQTAAFEAGFRAARGRIVVTMDGDLQIDPRDVPLMLQRLGQGDVDFVYGWRKDRQDDFLKRVSTKVANAVRNRLTRERIPDTGCPLKAFKAEVVKRMKLFTGMHRFFITLAHMDGWRSAQMVVRHRPRQHGRSKYGVWNRVFRALRDCLVVRWMMVRHLRYEVDEAAAPPAAAPERQVVAGAAATPAERSGEGA